MSPSAMRPPVGELHASAERPFRSALLPGSPQMTASPYLDTSAARVRPAVLHTSSPWDSWLCTAESFTNSVPGRSRLSPSCGYCVGSDSCAYERPGHRRLLHRETHRCWPFLFSLRPFSSLSGVNHGSYSASWLFIGFGLDRVHDLSMSDNIYFKNTSSIGWHINVAIPEMKAILERIGRSLIKSNYGTHAQTGVRQPESTIADLASIEPTNITV